MEIKPFSLKPCPFCGSEVSIDINPLWSEFPTRGYPGCYDYSIRCKQCGCTLYYPNNDSVYRSEEEAMANVVVAWNRREENGRADL